MFFFLSPLGQLVKVIFIVNKCFWCESACWSHCNVTDMYSCILTPFSSAFLVLPNHDNECVTRLQSPNIVCHHSEDRKSHKDTAKHISTKLGTDRRLFGSVLTPECWSGKTKMAGNHYSSLLKMKDNFSINHNPKVWQNQLLKCIRDTFFFSSS